MIQVSPKCPLNTSFYFADHNKLTLARRLYIIYKDDVRHFISIVAPKPSTPSQAPFTSIASLPSSAILTFSQLPRPNQPSSLPLLFPSLRSSVLSTNYG